MAFFLLGGVFSSTSDSTASFWTFAAGFLTRPLVLVFFSSTSISSITFSAPRFLFCPVLDSAAASASTTVSTDAKRVSPTAVLEPPEVELDRARAMTGREATSSACGDGVGVGVTSSDAAIDALTSGSTLLRLADRRAGSGAGEVVAVRADLRAGAAGVEELASVEGVVSCSSTSMSLVDRVIAARASRGGVARGGVREVVAGADTSWVVKGMTLSVAFVARVRFLGLSATSSTTVAPAACSLRLRRSMPLFAFLPSFFCGNRFN